MVALLALDRLEKRYGAVQAVDGVSVAFEAGRLHVVVGENGAGKSTLLKMAAGAVRADAGEVRIDGVRLEPYTPHEAIRRGVSMVQQHFALVGVLTALQNVMLGAEPVTSFGRLDVDAARARAQAVASDMGVRVPWDAPVETLGVGDRQRLEIVRALVREARVLLLDEPTAVLTPREADALYAALRRLADAGRAVVVVTHRLDEVRDHADVVTVMRTGRVVSTRAGLHADPVALHQLTCDIMGQEPPPPLERRAREHGEVRLDVRDLRLGRALRGVSLQVRAGQILGIAGVEGNGQRELVRVLAGLQVPDGGEVQGDPIAVVHEDRHAEGLVLAATVRDNLVLGQLARFTRFGLVDRRALELTARSRLERAGIVPPDLDAPAAALSGGNQQKIVVARAIARAPEVGAFVFAQPTRGVDLVAARAIHAEIVRVAEAGKAVLVVSADLAELHALCERLLVMSRGRIVADLPAHAADDVIGDAMLGGAGEGPAEIRV